MPVREKDRPVTFRAPFVRCGVDITPPALREVAQADENAVDGHCSFPHAPIPLLMRPHVLVGQ